MRGLAAATHRAHHGGTGAGRGNDPGYGGAHKPVTFDHDTAWMGQAACAGFEFDPDDGDPFYPDDWRDAELVSRGKAVCAGCPVVLACRDFAVAERVDDGIWGATTPRERFWLREEAAQRNAEEATADA
jgi:WhiB family redox-sensing transcriptional regulator